MTQAFLILDLRADRVPAAGHLSGNIFRPVLKGFLHDQPAGFQALPAAVQQVAQFTRSQGRLFSLYGPGMHFLDKNI